MASGLDNAARKAQFLIHLYNTGNVSASARNIKADRHTVYDWRALDESFAAMWEQALESRRDDMEQEIHRRGFAGVDEPVIYKGELCYVIDEKDGTKRPLTVKKYSDQLAQLAIRAERPKKFREQIELQGSLDISARIFAARKRVGGS